MKKNLSRQDFVFVLSALVIFILISSRPLQGQQPGSVDLSFQTGISSIASIAVLAFQKDGKLIVAGDFNSVSGISRNRVARLNNDGSLDGTFDPGAGSSGGPSNYEGKITALTLQSDGRLLLGGCFTMVDGVDRRNLARLTQDGSLNASFHFTAEKPNLYPIVYTRTLALQSDGKILAGRIGFDTAAYDYLFRLNADGSPDSTFQFAFRKQLDTALD